MPFVLNSSAFVRLGTIPKDCTCEGADRAPSLSWSGAPPGTKSFALIVDDPDAPDPAAPTHTYVHWVVYDMPPTTKGLVQMEPFPPGTRQGKNETGRTGYTGPCPPKGKHRYFFKLYALDTVLGDLKSPTKSQLEKAMKDHILAKAELIGMYEKAKKKA
jgi:Raf kinase inhibitor-like YbhB/YbcL family protein